MRAFCSFLLLLVVQATNGQAPGDEDDVCVQFNTFVNEIVLMDSLNYRDLVGGPWIVVDRDDNNDALGGTSSPRVSEINYRSLLILS